MDLWTFGDSFASTSPEGHDWFSLLTNDFEGNEYYNHFCDARDTQTIMDSFYRNLCNIKPNSFVVVWLPSLARLRFPKKKEYFKKLREASFTTSDKSAFVDGLGKFPTSFDVVEYFTHFPYFDYPNGQGKPELDFPFDTFDYAEFDNKSYINYETYYDGFSKLRRGLSLGISPTDFYKLIQISKASVENWNKIFKSLKDFCDFDIVFVSWTDEYNKENVLGKTQLTREIGFWHTKDMEYNESNGEEGLEYDEHFSKKMNRAFADFIKNKYPKYFKE